MKRNLSILLSRGRVLVSLLAAAGVGAVTFGLTSWIWSWPLKLHAADRTVVSVNVSDAPVPRETKLSTSFAPVVKRVAPGVVYVYSTKTVRNPSAGSCARYSTIRSSENFSVIDSTRTRIHRAKSQARRSSRASALVSSSARTATFSRTTTSCTARMRRFVVVDESKER